MALPQGLWQKHFGQDSSGVESITHPNFCSFMDELAEIDGKELEELAKAKGTLAETEPTNQNP